MRLTPPKLLSTTVICGTSFVSFMRRKKMAHPYATRTVALACPQASTYIQHASSTVFLPLTLYSQEPLIYLAQQS